METATTSSEEVSPPPKPETGTEEVERPPNTVLSTIVTEDTERPIDNMESNLVTERAEKPSNTMDSGITTEEAEKPPNTMDGNLVTENTNIQGEGRDMTVEEVDTQREGRMVEEAARQGEETDMKVDVVSGEEQVQVIYLDMPESDQHQVLDISNFLAQGLQVETIEVEGNKISSGETVFNIKTEMNVTGDQPDVQSADALLRLAMSQDIKPTLKKEMDMEGQVEEVEIISQDASSAEALLQLSSDPNAKTYIVDENGTMIPLDSVRASNLIEVSDTGVTTLALSRCWCGSEFLSQDDLDSHKQTCTQAKAKSRQEPSVIKCSLCNAKFTSSKDLSEHQAWIHPEGMPWECDICQRRFPRKMGLKAHMRAHAENKEYNCSSCRKTFYYKTALLRHMKMHNCDDPFKCTTCGDVFKTQWDLRKHRVSHQPQKVYRCDVCAKTFKQKQTLVIHARVHSGQKPFSCEVCERTFSLRSTLKQHQRIHTGEKPSVCPICGRGFRQTSTLKSHLKIHTCLKPYMCRYCKMRFAYVDEVTDHEHQHLANKNWHCDECGMRFRNQSLLARHSRVHTNERPFQCKVCQKCFVQSGSLQAHMRSHTKEKPYQCRWCKRAYTTSGTLLIHIRKAHKVDAKKVKDVFPNMKYVEGQKIFKIRTRTNRLPSSSAPEDSTNLIEEDEVAESNMATDLIAKTNEEDSIPIEESPVVDVVSDRRDISSAIEEGVVEGVLSSPHQEQGQKDSARARQEAALGLAELSLLGGEEMQQSRRSGQRTKTFFKEEEDDENDPEVTKIILSKEGGVMTSQDPHQCPVCARIFGRKSIMVEHMRIHTDEKPYECDFCPDAFRQNAQLRSHIRNRHTDVECYQCSFCHKKFLSPSITIRHIKFHHKLKVKFCLSADPSWTIESAVWSDEKFKLNVKDPQFLQTDKKQAQSGNSASLRSRPGKQGFRVILESSDIASVQPSQENVELTLTSQPPLSPRVANVPSPSLASANSEEPPDVGAVEQVGAASPEKTKLEGVSCADMFAKGKQLNLDNSSLHCSSCDVAFNGVRGLQDHLKEVHNTTLSDVNVKVVEEDTVIMSSEVQTGEDDDTSLVAHEDQGTNIVIYDDKEKCVDDPQNHAFACGICMQGYPSRHACEMHMRSHTEEEVARMGMHRCDTCGYVMKTTQQVSKHIVKAHGLSELFECSICHKDFYQLSSVHRHMRFFHKWEMKIRGEETIPVLTKPAPKELHAPSGRVQTRAKRMSSDWSSCKVKSPKTESGEEVTYITLDLENLEIFQRDGTRVPFDVVSSTEWGKTLKIRPDDTDNSPSSQEQQGEGNSKITQTSGPDCLSPLDEMKDGGVPEQSEHQSVPHKPGRIIRTNSVSETIKKTPAGLESEYVKVQQSTNPSSSSLISGLKRVSTLPLPVCLDTNTYSNTQFPGKASNVIIKQVTVDFNKKVVAPSPAKKANQDIKSPPVLPESQSSTQCTAPAGTTSVVIKTSGVTKPDGSPTVSVSDKSDEFIQSSRTPKASGVVSSKEGDKSPVKDSDQGTLVPQASGDKVKVKERRTQSPRGAKNPTSGGSETRLVSPRKAKCETPVVSEEKLSPQAIDSSLPTESPVKSTRRVSILTKPSPLPVKQTLVKATANSGEDGPMSSDELSPESTTVQTNSAKKKTPVGAKSSVSKNVKKDNMKTPSKRDLTALSPDVSRSSSGRIIKRKRYD